MDLRRFLFEEQISVKEFAEDVGVSASLIYHILKRRRTPSRDLAIRIEKRTRGAIPKESLLFPDEPPVQNWAFGEDDIRNSFQDLEERILYLEKNIKYLSASVKRKRKKAESDKKEKQES